MRLVILWVAILLPSFLVSGAQAQGEHERPRADGAAEEPAGEQSARTRSRALAMRAQEQFAQGDADAATTLLLEARLIYGEPLLSYNLARVYDSVGDHHNALASYERYLAESPDATNRAPIELRIAALRETIEALDAPPSSAAPSPLDGGSGPGPWPWVVSVTGGATLLAGAVLGGLARSTRNDAAEEFVHREAVQTQDRAQRQATSANVLFAVGGTFAGVGLLWALIAGLRSKRQSSSSSANAGLRVHPEFGMSGASVNLQW